MKRTIAATLVCLFLSLVLHSQILIYNKSASKDTWLRGMVKDKVTGEAVPFTLVYLAGTIFGVQTDFNGYFSMKCIPGNFMLRVETVAYFPDSLKIQIDSGYMTIVTCLLKSRIADSATIHPEAGKIYGLVFTKRGEIDSIRSSYASLDSLVSMLNDKPLKKISIIVGFRYEDGSFEPVNKDEIFIRKYLTSKGVSNDRLPFDNYASGTDEHITPIRIVDINAVKPQRHNLLHHQSKTKTTRKGKGKMEVRWSDQSVPWVRIEL